MSKELTAKFIKSLNPASVIYAEIARPGAMGNEGGVMMYILEDDGLNLYETDIFKHEDDYAAAYNFLRDNEKIFCVANGGFGNTAYALADSKLEDDTQNEKLVYTKNGKKYDIFASVKGVYKNVHEELVKLTNFPKEKQVTKLFEAYKKTIEHREKSSNGKVLSAEHFLALFSDENQLYFVKAIFSYFSDLHRTSRREEIFLSPKDWENALRYIFAINSEAFNYGSEIMEQGKVALWKYRLKYAIEKLGFFQFFNIIDDYLIGENLDDTLSEKNIQGRVGKIFEKIDAKLGEKLEEKFAKITVKKSDKNDFRYPQLVEFSDTEDDTIIKKIIYNDFYYGETEYYLKNYLNMLDTKSLRKILPAACAMVLRAEYYDFELFYTAGDIINQAWKITEENKRDADEEKIKEIIYKIYWKKIGDTWPLLHYGWDIYFNMNSRALMFEDAASWLSALGEETLNSFSPDVAMAVGKYREQVQDESYIVNKYIEADSVEDVKKIFEKMFSNEPEIYNLPSALERILLNRNKPDIRIIIFEEFAKHYADAKKIVKDFDEANGLESKDEDMIYYFTAACEGASSTEELPALKKFSEIFYSDTPSKKDIIQAGLKIAERNIKTAEFQKKEMRNFIQEFNKYPSLIKEINQVEQ